MGKYFGTDGVRGIANKELTPELAFRLGRVGGYVLTKKEEKSKVVIGRDTRISGELLEMSLAAGLMSIGVDVVRLGIIPTPAVAYLTKKENAQAGIMISASHNPYPDNGIKFFGSDGFKLLDDMEKEIERLLEGEDNLPRTVGSEIGRVYEKENASREYIDFLKGTVNQNEQTRFISSDKFSNLKIILDCANGASFSTADKVFTELGTKVITLSDKPDGTNINVNCGSTHPRKLQETVVREKADIGLAYDGDADRLIAIDHEGNIIDGDQILYICAKALKEENKLKENTLVATVMSNFGMAEALEKEGIDLIHSSVGDKYVMEKMREGKYNLGGEQSGHMIFLDLNTTGDGVLSSLQLVNIVAQTGKTLKELASGMKKFPQLMINVHVTDKEAWKTDEEVQKAIKKGEEELAGRGRILVRPSGTEPLVRVMAEGPEEKIVERIVRSIVDKIEK